MSRVVVKTSQATIEGLELGIQSYKSLLADYALRTRNAEQAAAAHLGNNAELFAMVAQHMREQSNSRSLHYKGLIDKTILALSALAADPQALTPEAVNKIVQSLQMATAQ